MKNISKNIGSVEWLKKVKHFMVEYKHPVYNLRKILIL